MLDGKKNTRDKRAITFFLNGILRNKAKKKTISVLLAPAFT